MVFQQSWNFILFSRFGYFQNMKPKKLLSFFGYLLEPCIEMWRFFIFIIFFGNFFKNLLVFVLQVGTNQVRLIKRFKDLINNHDKILTPKSQ